MPRIGLGVVAMVLAIGCAPSEVRAQWALERTVGTMGFERFPGTRGREVGEVVEVLPSGDLRAICSAQVAATQASAWPNSSYRSVSASYWDLRSLRGYDLWLRDLSLQMISDVDVLSARCTSPCRHAIEKALREGRALSMISQTLKGTVDNKHLYASGTLGVRLDSHLPSLLLENL